MSKGLITIDGKEVGKPALIKKENSITIDGKEMGSGGLVDLVFIIDTTISMSGKIHGLLKICSEFVDDFARLGLDQQIAVVSYGYLAVPGDRIDASLFTSKIEVVKRYLSDIHRNYGGGRFGESSPEAIENAITLGFRPGSVQVFILITDEHARNDWSRIEALGARLIRSEILVFVISDPQDCYKRMAKQSGGSWYQIAADTNFSSILDLFRAVSKKVSQVVLDVHQLGHGSVSRYRQLSSGK